MPRLPAPSSGGFYNPKVLCGLSLTKLYPGSHFPTEFLPVFLTCATSAQQDGPVPRKKKLPEEGAPEIVREGNAQMKIYASAIRDRPRFIVAYRGVDRKRETQSLSDYDRAKQEAKLKAIAIHNGTLETLDVT